MKELIATIRERNFRSIFFRNLLKVFPVLFVPLLIFSVIIVLLLSRRQASELTSEASSEITRIASRTDTMIGSLNDETMALCFEDPVTAFGRYAFSPLTIRKRNALIRLQNRLSTVGSSNPSVQTSLILYQGATGYIVSPTTAVTVPLESGDSGNYTQYRLMAAGSTPAPTAKKNGDTISIFCAAPSSFGRTVSFIDLSVRDLSRQLSLELSRSDAVILLHDNDSAVLCSSSSGFSPSLKEHPGSGSILVVGGKRYVYIEQPSSIFGWSYSLYYPADNIANIGSYATVTALTLLLLTLLVSFVSAWLITTSVSRPVRIILDLLENPEKGNMDYYRHYCEKYDELNVILTLIESSYFQTMAMSKQLEEQNRRLNSAQNYALAVQMNPHFIFNTLDSLNWKIAAELKDRNTISPALADFSKIIRYALNKKGLVPLSEELECSRIYIRLKNSLSSIKIPVSWDVDEELLDVKVPFLILQPLLENAFSYGAHTRKEEAKIAVRCHSCKDSMCIEVEDNGTGFSPEKLEEINRLLVDDVYYETSSHIGIINTHNRIRLSYGDEWGISISSDSTRTIVSMRFPRCLRS